MQLKIQNKKLLNFGKICSKFFFLTLFSIIFLFHSKNTCFLLIPVKFVVVLRKRKFFKKSEMADKMADMLGKRLLPWQQFLIKT